MVSAQHAWAATGPGRKMAAGLPEPGGRPREAQPTVIPGNRSCPASCSRCFPAPRRLAPARARRLGPGLGHGGVQVLRCRASCGCLGSVPLGLAEFDNGGRQRCEVGYQRRGERGDVIGYVTSHSQQPRRGAQAVPVSAAARDPAVTGAGGPVVGVGRAPQDRAAQRPRRGMQRVSRRPRGVGRCGRVAVGAMADVLRGPCGLAGGVLVDRVPFRDSEPERRAARVARRAAM